MADGAGALEGFRNEVRAWLEANCPPAMRTPMPEDEVVWGGRNVAFKRPEAKQWLEAMGQKGWTAPTWPKAYGGGGLTAAAPPPTCTRAATPPACPPGC